METALPVAEALHLSIKVEPGICEILTVAGGFGSGKWENRDIPEAVILSKMGKVRKTGDSPKIGLCVHGHVLIHEISILLLKDLHTFLHELIMNMDILYSICKETFLTVVICQVYPPGFLDTDQLQQHFGSKNSVGGSLDVRRLLKSSNSTVRLC